MSLTTDHHKHAILAADNSVEGEPSNIRNKTHYDIDVTRTELSADPVKKMGKVGCQSTVVIAAL